MALFDVSPTAARRHAPGLFTRLAAAYHAWNDRRSTRAALARLSSHELEDIGLDHGDTEVVADGRRRSR